MVVSTAVRADNPEVVEALRRGLRLLPRSAALESLMQGHRVVAVAGTHGKTTTTSLLTMALLATDADPTYAVGGDLADTGTNAHQGGGDLFVAEADESDGAFLVYSPYAAAVTTVDADHLDVWGTEQAYREAFDSFVARLDPDGLPRGQRRRRGRGRTRRAGGRAGPRAGHRVRRPRPPTCGSAGSAPRATAPGPRSSGAAGRPATCGSPCPAATTPLDAALALAVGLRLGLDFDDLTRGMAGFSGTRRRMERKGEAGGVRVYDSYAHHPVEIAGDLEAARALAGDGRLVVCFQPHLVSRTRIFGAAMGRALGAADEVVVLDVYLAREDPEPGVDGAPGRRRGAAAAGACPRRARPRVGARAAGRPGRRRVTWC